MAKVALAALLWGAVMQFAVMAQEPGLSASAAAEASAPTAMALFVQRWLGGAAVGLIAFAVGAVFFAIRNRRR